MKATTPIVVPDPDDIRDRIRERRAEIQSLQKLLKLSAAAKAVQQIVGQPMRPRDLVRG